MDTLFLDYENSLIKREKNIGTYNFYGAEPGGANQQRAISCIRYALEEILEWDVEESVNKFDDYIIREMKLERVIGFISFPSEVEQGDPRYILSLLYPERIKLNQQKLVEQVYKGVLSGSAQFPREYFSGTNGFYRFCACLQYLLINYKPFSSLEDLYDFVLSPEGNKFLYQYRLKVPADQLEISLIDCVHIITKEEPDSELYYCYYSFNQKIKESSSTLGN
jgi:hypothetical protein